MNLFLILLSFLQFFISPGVIESDDNCISLTIKGITANKGTVQIGVFNTSKGFPDRGNQYKGYEFEVLKNQRTYKISNLPKGNYAIAIFHDENSNKKLDKNFLGIPTESYGFSNDARASFSAPSFESARFYHDGSTNLTIKIY